MEFLLNALRDNTWSLCLAELFLYRASRCVIELKDKNKFLCFTLTQQNFITLLVTGFGN